MNVGLGKAFRGKSVVVKATGAMLLVGAFAAAVILGRWARSLASPQPVADAAALSRGEILFQTHCAKCHGPEGHGDGESAATMRPPPRDFASRPWRFEPTAEAIRQVLERGIPGTSMPAVGQTLPPADVDALVAEVLRLAVPSESSPSVELTAAERVVADAGFSSVPEVAAPELSLIDSDGNIVTLDQFQGQVVLLNFWGLGCEHCLAKMDALRKLELKHEAAGLRVLSVCIDAEDAAQAQEAATGVAPGHRVYCDERGLAAQRFEVQVLPTIWLIGRDGKLAAKGTGSQQWLRPELDRLLQSLLDEANDGASTNLSVTRVSR